MEQHPHFPDITSNWLASPLGQALLAQEGRIVEEALDGMFGEQCLQLGLWGEPRTFLRHARTQGTAFIESAAVAESQAAIGEFHRLPVANDAIDCVILPHTLDFSDRPHAILREVHRVLRSHGLSPPTAKPGPSSNNAWRSRFDNGYSFFDRMTG